MILLLSRQENLRKQTLVVKGASLEEGLLQIELERQVPEAMKTAYAHTLKLGSYRTGGR